MNTHTCKIFLDSCNPQETAEAVKLLGHIDGQTTNPTLLVKNPEVASYVARGKKISEIMLMSLYEKAIREIVTYTDGPVSVEVYADAHTSSTSMLAQAHTMQSWHNSVYIKFPTIPEGLKAAKEFGNSGGNVNMTLVFDQQQAAAVYVATQNARGGVLVSPFVGRWENKGFNGLDLISNIRSMYNAFDMSRDSVECHVQILAASLRSTEHLHGAIARGADIITAPLQILRQWKESASERFASKHTPSPANLKPIPYISIQLVDDYAQYPIDQHPDGLLAQGLSTFASDWNAVVEA